MSEDWNAIAQEAERAIVSAGPVSCVLKKQTGVDSPSAALQDLATGGQTFDFKAIKSDVVRKSKENGAVIGTQTMLMLSAVNEKPEEQDSVAINVTKETLALGTKFYTIQSVKATSPGPVDIMYEVYIDD